MMSLYCSSPFWAKRRLPYWLLKVLPSLLCRISVDIAGWMVSSWQVQWETHVTGTTTAQVDNPQQKHCGLCGCLLNSQNKLEGWQEGQPSRDLAVSFIAGSGGSENAAWVWTPIWFPKIPPPPTLKIRPYTPRGEVGATEQIHPHRITGWKIQPDHRRGHGSADQFHPQRRPTCLRRLPDVKKSKRNRTT